MEGIKAKTLFDFLQHLSRDELDSIRIRFHHKTSDGEEEYFLAEDIHLIFNEDTSICFGEKQVHIAKDIVLTLI